MLKAFRDLVVSQVLKEEVARKEVTLEEVKVTESEITDDKVLDFTQWFLGDVYGYLAESTGLNIEFVEQDDNRCVPEQFYAEMMSFSKVFIDKLMPDMSQRSVLLFRCEFFFERFANFVCLKLIKDDNPEMDFLKVIAFLLVLVSMSFKYRCCHSLVDIPGVLYFLLKAKLKTKFYEKHGFDDIILLCNKLSKDEKWYESTVEEIRNYMADIDDLKLAAEICDDSSPPDLTTTLISDVKLKHSTSNSQHCPYCETDCIVLLTGIWKPRKDFAFPDCQLM